MLWVKTFHVLFVIAWMSALFYLPRILVHFVEGRNAGEDVRRLAVMGRKLYRFGHVMMGFTIMFGGWLWLGYGITGKWLHAKLTLTVLLIVYYVFCGRLLKRAAADGALPGATALRVLNEAPVFVVLAILVLVIVKPF